MPSIGEVVEIDNRIYRVVDVKEQEHEDGSIVEIVTYEPVQETRHSAHFPQ